MDVGLIVGVVAIGFIHGVLPDHGWPIAAVYGLNRSRTWFYGTLAGLVLGVGHLISSVVLVLAYFWFSQFAEIAEGPVMRYLAGAMLIVLGINEYRNAGHGRSQVQTHDEMHTTHDGSQSDKLHRTADRSHSKEYSTRGTLHRIRDKLRGGNHRHLSEEDADRGVLALGWTALLLGFAHEEPIQILAICAGTAFCLELMVVYSIAVIVAILIPTLLLIAGYERHKDTVERYTPYLPLLTAVVLVGMGLAFIGGIF